MPDAAVNTDQITYWNDAAGKTWAEYQDALDRQIEPLGARVMEVLAPAPGERVLDIGCGCGQTTLELARRVGPSGAVVGVDISQPMLAVARERAAGAPQASFLEADAQTHPFEAGAFDAIHSRFGVMFFQDPVAAFANLRRALKPGGRLGFLCWRAPAENPIMTLPLAAAAPHLPPPAPPTPGAPGPFAFADGDRVRGILADAGFQDIGIEPQDMAGGGNSLDAALELALRIGPLGAQLRQYPQAREAVIADVRAALASHLKDGRVYLSSATWIVSARTG
jgi:SAM-dependent methyltransferase